MNTTPLPTFGWQGCFCFDSTVWIGWERRLLFRACQLRETYRPRKGVDRAGRAIYAAVAGAATARVA